MTQQGQNTPPTKQKTITTHLHTALRLVVCMLGLISAITVIVLVAAVAVMTVVVDRVGVAVRGRMIETRNKKGS